MKGLTDRQYEYLRVIRNYIRAFGRAPTLRELRKLFNVRSTNAVASVVGALERKGQIRMAGKKGGARRIQVVGVCPACGR